MQRSIDIELDKPRTLKYTWDAIRWLKDSQGILVGSVDTLAVDWTLLAPWIVAGLRHEDKKITVQDVEKHIPLEPEGYDKMAMKVLVALGAAEANDVPKEKDENPTDSLQTTTGVNSIKSPTAA